MKDWINKMLGVRTIEPPPLSATDDYVIVNRQELDKLIGELNNHYKPTWVGMTDEERNKLWRDVVGWGDPSHDDEDLMKALEAKLKEKNT